MIALSPHENVRRNRDVALQARSRIERENTHASFDLGNCSGHRARRIDHRVRPIRGAMEPRRAHGCHRPARRVSRRRGRHQQGRQADLLAVATGAKVDLVWFENPTWTRHVMASGFPGMINADAFDTDKDGYPEIALQSGFSTTPAKGDGGMTLLTKGADVNAPWTAKEFDRDAVGASRAMDRCRRQRPQDASSTRRSAASTARRPTTRTRSPSTPMTRAGLETASHHRRR